MSGDREAPLITPSVIWKIYHMPIIFGSISFLFIALSITIFIKSYQPIAPITFSSDEGVSSVSGVQTTTDAPILVDIEGAVMRPGVYRLALGSRVDEAIGAAGGFANDVDMGAVARTMNRAAKLADGAKVYIPKVGDSHDEEARSTAGGGEVHTDGINVNTAPQSELETLAGVGPVTAGKIVGGRPYMRLEELVEKKAMSLSLFEKLKDQLTL